MFYLFMYLNVRRYAMSKPGNIHDLLLFCCAQLLVKQFFNEQLKVERNDYMYEKGRTTK